MENKIKDLKESPLYNLSLVNKELFHSNFIAWFGKTYPKLFIVLIEELLGGKKWLDGDKFDIRREFNHFDISVFEGENLKLVIENKVKSIPTQNQLDEYKNKIKNENVQLILLTMNEQLHESTSAQDNENIGWKIVNYRKLSKGLKLIKDKIDNDYHKGLLTDYCTYISNLELVIEDYTKNEKYFDEEKYTTLKELGIHDVCGKREMQDIYNKLVKRLNEEGIATNNSDVLVKWAYTNAEPLIEVKFTYKDDNIFIQIQGYQYRHAVEFFDNKIGDKIEKKEKGFYPSEAGIEYLTDTYPYFFGEDAIKNYPDLENDLENDTKEFGMRKKQGYCKYCNGKPLANGYISCWVYQWIKIPENIKKANLINAICKDTQKIINFLKDSENGEIELT